MARYLLVDDRRSRVVAELASAEQAARLLARLGQSAHGDPGLSVVRLDHQEGSLTEVDSLVSIRPLSPPS